jgi:hypothetical protein
VLDQCKGPMCQDKPSHVELLTRPGLCSSCRAGLLSHLATMSNLYECCEELLLNKRVSDVGRVRGGLPGGISLNSKAVTIRSEMMRVLASWAGLVVDELRIGRPPRRDVRALATFLRVYLDWLAEHPAAPEAAAEIAARVSDAENVLAPDAADRVELGPCGQAGCGGVVSIVVRGGDDWTSKTIECDGGHVWPPQQWLMLKYRIEQAGRGSRAGRDRRAKRIA